MNLRPSFPGIQRNERVSSVLLRDLEEPGRAERAVGNPGGLTLCPANRSRKQADLF
jgi:hypothetical protein